MHKIQFKFQKSFSFWGFAPEPSQEFFLWSQLEHFRSSDPFYMSTPCRISKYATGNTQIYMYTFLIDTSALQEGTAIACHLAIKLSVSIHFRTSFSVSLGIVSSVNRSERLQCLILTTISQFAL